MATQLSSQCLVTVKIEIYWPTKILYTGIQNSYLITLRICYLHLKRGCGGVALKSHQFRDGSIT